MKNEQSPNLGREAEPLYDYIEKTFRDKTVKIRNDHGIIEDGWDFIGVDAGSGSVIVTKTIGNRAETKRFPFGLFLDWQKIEAGKI